MWPFRGGAGVGSVAGGIVGTADLLVSAPGSGMSVNVASGEIIIPGGVGATQSGYYCYVTSTTNLAIGSSNPSNPRIDLTCGTVDDKAYSGSVDDFKLQVIAGTPAGSPVVPSLPASSGGLANVAVPASATSIITGDITDKRVAALGKPYGEAWATGTTSVPNSGTTGVALAGSKTGYGVTFGSSALTVNRAGRYLIIGQVGCGATQDGAAAAIAKNGSFILGVSNFPTTTVVGAVSLTSGDVITLNLANFTGSTLTVQSGQDITYLHVFYLGPN